MKILHYSLGFPPYRSGGLTKYATDLMEEQVKQGNEVSLLWPGKINIFYRKPKIKKLNRKFEIGNYELINPLPVPLMNGINDIKNYTKTCNKIVYEEFLKKVNPDIIHIHTLMGIHKEFFQVAKEFKIKLVYTSHDYFGICPKVNLLYNEMPCNNDSRCLNCTDCNKGALSMKKIMILQSLPYRVFKESTFIKKMRTNYKKNITYKEDIEKEKKDIDNRSVDYIELREYYLGIFHEIDFIHFNSNLAKDIYSKHLSIKSYEVIPILHKNIKDNRRIKNFNSGLKITYLGQTEVYKGFYLLKESLDKLYKEGYENFALDVYYQTVDSAPYMKVHNGFHYGELKNIFEKTDLLVVPSVWYETFSFVAMEGYSYGVPLIVTTNVGAKDIIKENSTGFIIEPNVIELKEKIKEIYKNREILKDINKEIVNTLDIDLTFNNHVKKINKLYKEILHKKQ